MNEAPMNEAEMNEAELARTGSDGMSIRGYRWSGDGAPKAIINLAHGMGEHAARYRRFAQALVDDGYVVYANDHRGHGRTAAGAERGADGHGDLGPAGWRGLVDDLGTLNQLAREEHPDTPLVMFGHSMGSFALQQFLIERSSETDAAILSGTSAIDVIGAGIDPDAEVDLSAFNEPFEPAPTEYEWLSRDRAEVDAYVADDACGFGIDAAAARSMLEGTSVAGDPAKIAHVRSELPIYLMSGDADPLAGGGELIELVAQRYREAGVSDVTVARYPDARHELLNETNRDAVTTDVLAWLDRTVAGL